MSEFASDQFVNDLSTKLAEIQLVEPAVSDGFGIEAAIALAEQQLLSKVLATVLSFLSEFGVMLPNKQQMLDLIDKAIDVAIAAIGQRNPFFAKVLNSTIVRSRLRAALSTILDKIFNTIEV